MSRRGVATLSLELFVALLVAASVLVIMLVYVQSSLESSGYFRDFYTKDLSMLSDVATAAPGELSVTYNNLKQGMGLVFLFEEGFVEVSIQEEFSKRGVFSIYDDLVTTRASFDDPSFISFMKSKNSFRVSEATGVVRSCERVTSEQRPNPIIWSNNESEERLLQQGVRETLSVAGLELFNQESEENNIYFGVTFEEGTRVATIEYRDSPEMTFMMCLLENNLATQGIEVSSQEVSSLIGEHNHHARIVIGREDINPQILGQLIGQSVVIYAR